MKRWIALIIVGFVLFATLFGCGAESAVMDTDDFCNIGTDEVYGVREIDGEYYIVISKSKADSLSGISQLASLSFASMDDLIDTLINGNFRDWQLDVINSAFPKDKNGIKIFDYKHTYVPIIPRGFSSREVTWAGENYTYLYVAEDKDGPFFYVQICTDDLFDSTLRREYDDLFNNKNISVDKTVRQDEKMIYHYSTSMGEFKDIRFSFENKGVRYIVNEHYRLKFNDESMGLKVSDSVPSEVALYIEKLDDKQKAIITIFNLTQPLDYSEFSISDRK